VGHCGAEISYSFICNKLSSLVPEMLGTTLFQNGCLAFRSLATSDLCLKFKSSVIAASFWAWPGNLLTVTSSTSLLPIGPRPLWLLLKQGEAGLPGTAFCHCNSSFQMCL
jgi:hypothetical protein